MSGERDIIERLSRLDTCAVSDALDRLGLRGATTGVGPLWPCPRICGRAVTMKLKPAGLDQSKQHLGTRAIEAAEGGDIIVIDNAGRPISAWGGLLSLAAKLKGVAGVIVDGACRDVDESRELGFPVYARSAAPMTARGRILEQSCNEEVQFAGVQVHPGDVVIADGSGVVFVPRQKETEVLEAAEQIAHRESLMAAEIRKGRAVSEVMGLSYESMLKDGGRQ